MSENDLFQLNRFVEAQESTYDEALAEVRAGRKRTHWMWFVFPQFAGLGSSERAVFYSIKSWDEAKAYLEHPVLGARLLECFEAALAVEGRTAYEIFGSPDDVKAQSSATLFEAVAPEIPVFAGFLGKYFDGERDGKTLELLGG